MNSHARRIAFAVALAFMPGLEAGAAELKGVQMPDTELVGATSLMLNGMGVRKTLIVKDVYVAGLYVEKSLEPPVKDENKILESKTIKKLDLEFVMYVPGASMRDAWEHGLKRNCREDCNFSEQLKTFKDWMRNFKRGERVGLVFYPAHVEVLINGESKGRLEGAKFSRTLLAVFIGNPPNQELKEGLLKLK
ncbi:MAG TPA: chalcone isomerase family protein [Bdellovibrionales bacterium]|nr:chalcone isomerase family protein [Bdellovibrionales bacterium]